MDLPLWTYALAVVAGLFAGIVNTMAGSGSLVTLPMLVFLGLPTPIANATNRVGVTVQNIVSLTTLRRRGALELQSSAWYVVPVLIGSVAGAQVAVELDERTLNLVIGGIMAAMLIVLLFNPRDFLAERTPQPGDRPAWWLLPVFLGIGFYGGFIQAGVGIMLLVGLVIGAKLGAMHANGIKLFLTLLFTAAALLVFAWHDQVDWAIGAIVATGQGAGGWVAARFLSESERAGVWIRRALIAVVAVSCFKFFGAF